MDCSVFPRPISSARTLRGVRKRCAQRHISRPRNLMQRHQVGTHPESPALCRFTIQFRPSNWYSRIAPPDTSVGCLDSLTDVVDGSSASASSSSSSSSSASLLRWSVRLLARPLPRELPAPALAAPDDDEPAPASAPAPAPPPNRCACTSIVSSLQYRISASKKMRVRSAPAGRRLAACTARSAASARTLTPPPPPPATAPLLSPPSADPVSSKS